MKYEDISKNGYPLGFLIKKVQDSSKNFNRTFTSHTYKADGYTPKRNNWLRRRFELFII